jgi:cell wall-associated NlpC family hydrolase
MKVVGGAIVALVFAALVGITSFFVGLTVGAGGALAIACGVTSSQTSPQSQASGPDKDVLIDAVAAKTNGDSWLTLVMLTGSHLESGWDRNASDGQAFGTFQIQMPGVVHPDITVEQAKDIAYATGYMYPYYLAASRREEVQSLRAAGNFQAAAEANAYLAERPAVTYSQSQGQQKVADAFQASVSLMQAHGLPVDFAPRVIDVAVADQQAATITGLSGNSCRSGATTSSGDAATLVAFSGATGSRQSVLEAASAQMGVPYAWGGGNANGATLGICTSGAAANDCHIKGFDCSGLTEYAYAHAGIRLPSTAAEQWRATRSRTVVPRGGDMAKAQPGDLIFFKGYLSLDNPGHVGIYLGDGKMINAPQSGEDVQIIKINTPYWQNGFVGVTDPFGPSV